MSTRTERRSSPPRTKASATKDRAPTSASNATPARLDEPLTDELRLEAPPEFRFTPAHLDAMQEDVYYRYELVDGRLLVSPAPTRTHEYAVKALIRAIDDHLGGPFAYPAGMDQRYDDDSVLIPDVIVFLPDGPDPIVQAPERLAEVVVEITSPSNRTRDFGAKRRANERNAVPEYWIVDLQERQIHVHVLEGDVYEVTTHGPDEPATSKLMDGLTIRLTDLEP